jgi:hypothetical protein
MAGDATSPCSVSSDDKPRKSFAVSLNVRTSGNVVTQLVGQRRMADPRRRTGFAAFAHTPLATMDSATID